MRNNATIYETKDLNLCFKKDKSRAFFQNKMSRSVFK